MKKMRNISVYLDTCVWCRPFDDVSNERIWEEAMAFVEILRKEERNEMFL